MINTNHESQYLNTNSSQKKKKKKKKTVNKTFFHSVRDESCVSVSILNEMHKLLTRDKSRPWNSRMLVREGSAVLNAKGSKDSLGSC